MPDLLSGFAALFPIFAIDFANAAATEFAILFHQYTDNYKSGIILG